MSYTSNYTDKITDMVYISEALKELQEIFHLIIDEEKRLKDILNMIEVI